LVAATNRDLLEMVARNEFRHDLYHRIATLRIRLAPLRDRPEDIEPLARHFLGQMSQEIGQRQLSPGAVQKLTAYPWPGNARELYNALYRAAALCDRDILEGHDIDIDPPSERVERQLFRLDEVPDVFLTELLGRHNGNVAAAARELHIPRTSLRDRIQRIPGLHKNRCSIVNAPMGFMPPSPSVQTN
jgi:DNA-binding NtrC family response regulator